MNEIIKGAEIPSPGFGAGRPAKYPFGLMEIGDSVCFGRCDNKESIRSAAYKYGSRNGLKFAGRIIHGEFFVWRTA